MGRLIAFFLYLCNPKLRIYSKMRKKYTKAEIKVIPVKIETNLCAGTNNSASAGGTQHGEGNNDPFGPPAKELFGMWELVDSLQEIKW